MSPQEKAEAKRRRVGMRRLIERARGGWGPPQSLWHKHPDADGPHDDLCRCPFCNAARRKG